MQGIKEILELKQRITSSGLIVSVLHLPNVSGMARDRKKVLLFCTCWTCPVCLPNVSGIVETRILIGMQLSFDAYNFLYLKLTQKLVIYQIYVDCEHLLNSNLNMALLLSVGQNR